MSKHWGHWDHIAVDVIGVPIAVLIQKHIAAPVVEGGFQNASPENWLSDHCPIVIRSEVDVAGLREVDAPAVTAKPRDLFQMTLRR